MTVTADQLRDAQARAKSARAELRELIHQAVAEDWSQTRIADALGITQSAVSQILNPERRRRSTRGGRGSSS